MTTTQTTALLCIDHAERAEILVTHPNGKCYGHLEWTDKGTTLVTDHCECPYNGQHPTVGCTVCGAKDIPVIGHRCSDV